MAKRFSQLRLKSMRNLTGKRQTKKAKAIKTSTRDLFQEDERVAPQIVKSVELPVRAYRPQRERQMEREAAGVVCSRAERVSK